VILHSLHATKMRVGGSLLGKGHEYPRPRLGLHAGINWHPPGRWQLEEQTQSQKKEAAAQGATPLVAGVSSLQRVCMNSWHRNLAWCALHIS
jgi:hypothetical protein